MTALALFLALVLATAAAHKVHSRDRLGAAAARLAGVSRSMGDIFLVLAGACEAIAAVYLVTPAAMLAGAMIAAVVWASYALTLWRRFGEVLDCGCEIVVRPRPVGLEQIMRAGLLAGFAFVVAILPTATLGWEPMFAAAGLFAVYLAASEIMSIPKPAWRKS